MFHLEREAYLFKLSKTWGFLVKPFFDDPLWSPLSLPTESINIVKLIVEGVDIESQSKYHTPKPSTKDFSKEFSRFISLSKDWAAFLSQFWKVWRLRKVFSRIALIEMFSVFNEMLSVFSVVYPWSQGWKTFLNQFEIVLKLKTSFLSLKHTFNDCKWKNIHLLKQKYFVFDFLFILVWRLKNILWSSLKWFWVDISCSKSYKQDL